eukprot:gene8515-biopygen5853
MREDEPSGAKVAVITDHEAIVHAQRRSNGFGGIGRGYALNKLFEYVYDLWYHRAIEVTFFFLSGKANPADSISRSFGGDPNDFGVFKFLHRTLGSPRCTAPTARCAKTCLSRQQGQRRTIKRSGVCETTEI